MKANILNIQGEKIQTIDLPNHFSEEVRPDLIRKVTLILQSRKRQPYGAFKEAGKRASTKISRRRRDYKGSYGRGISRVPRKTISRRGTQFTWIGALAPGTVAGRRAHPPKAEKKWKKDVNKKEKRKAIRSAIASTLNKDMLEKKGFSSFSNLPLIIEDKIENISKTKDIKQILEKLGLKIEIDRTRKKKIRPGKGKARGRRYKIKKGPLLVVSKECSLQKATNNLLGFDSCIVNNLNTELLAPGAEPGRLVIWTASSIEKLKGLFK